MEPVKTLTHLGATVIVTTVVLLAYATLQQACRSGGSDAQLQLARAISKNPDPEKTTGDWLNSHPAEIPQSVAGFIILFKQWDEASSVCKGIDSRLGCTPHEVFDFARNHWEYLFTWKVQLGAQVAKVLETNRNAFSRQMAENRSAYVNDPGKKKYSKSRVL